MSDTLELECPKCGAQLDDNNRCWRCDYEELQRKSADQTHALERKLLEKDREIKDLQYDLADAQRENMTMASKIKSLESSLVSLKQRLGFKLWP